MGRNSPITNVAGWPEVSLAEITTKIGSRATPRGGSETYLDSRIEYALIRSQNVFDRRFDRDGLAYITNEQADGLRGVVLQRSDVLLNITGDGVTFAKTRILRLLNTYSHSGAIADPGHDLTLLADAQPVLVDVLAFMESVDKDHYEGLKKLVVDSEVA